MHVRNYSMHSKLRLWLLACSDCSLPPLPLYTLFSHFIIHKFQLYKVAFRNLRFSFAFFSFLFNLRYDLYSKQISSFFSRINDFIYREFILIISFRTENGCNLGFSLIKFTKDRVSKNFDHGDEEFFFFFFLPLSPSVSLEKISCFCFLSRWNLSLCNLRSRAWERFDPLLPMNRTAKFSSTRTSFQDCLRCHDTVQNQDSRWAILPTSYPSFSSAFSFFPFIRASRAIIAPSLRLIKFCLFLFDLLSFPLLFLSFLFTCYI